MVRHPIKIYKIIRISRIENESSVNVYTDPSNGKDKKNNIRKELIYQLSQEGVTAEGTRYYLHYDKQDDKERGPLTWGGLIDELADQAALHGVEAVMNTAHIENEDANWSGDMKMLEEDLLLKVLKKG